MKIIKINLLKEELNELNKCSGKEISVFENKEEGIKVILVHNKNCPLD